MSPSPFKNDLFVILIVDEQPIWLYMTFPAIFEITGKLVVAMFWV